MSLPAIRAEGLSKQYRLGSGPPPTFREALLSSLRAPVEYLRGQRSESQDIWALRDVSFDVMPGEAVGVIGRNGVGKSTLLKVLSRITEPTSGRAEVRGRLASLLEVGTGFHPELTGRENVFLNGAVLGMSRREIHRKFDEIVTFAEIDRFLDTPAKHYSSGMYVRLAFAVAAHLDTDILLVDEVLAVGDAAFQKKCIAKMAEVTGQGRTILFVSHNLGTIVEFCPRSIWLSGGRTVADGCSVDIVRDYLARHSFTGTANLRDRPDLHAGPGPMRFASVEIVDREGSPQSVVGHGEPLTFAVTITGPRQSSCIVSISVRSALGTLVMELNSSDDRYPIVLESGEATLSIALRKNWLNHGDYYVSLTLWNQFYQIIDQVEDCLTFSTHTHASGQNRSRGLVRIPADWTIKPKGPASNL